MAIGAAVVALAYASLALVATSVGDGMTSWIWLLLFLVILTFGELWILPVGLELFGRLAPPGYAATTIAAWFFAGFVGNLLAGLLGSGWPPLGPAAFFGLMTGVAEIGRASGGERGGRDGER